MAAKEDAAIPRCGIPAPRYLTGWTAPLLGGVAAVNQVVASGDERGGIGDEEYYERGDLFCGAETSDGVLAREKRLSLRVEVGVDERRGDESGTDRVDPHALCRVLERGVLGQADD